MNYSPKTKSRIFVISGPSGSGKSTAVSEVLKHLKKAARMITCTTRKPRPSEKHGRDYYFLTKQEFKKRIKQNDFLEWARIHDAYYGISKKILEKFKKKHKIIIMTIDVQGAESIRQLKIPHTSIFINADSKENLISRISKRKGGISPEKLKIRLKTAAKELKQVKKFDYQVINYENKLDQTIEKILKIIKRS